MRVGGRLDRVTRDVGVHGPGRGPDALGIADKNGLDQAAIGREQGAAQRIVVVRADDDGFQRRQFGRERDELAEVVGRIHDQ